MGTVTVTAEGELTEEQATLFAALALVARNWKGGGVVSVTERNVSVSPQPTRKHTILGTMTIDGDKLSDFVVEEVCGSLGSAAERVGRRRRMHL